MQVRGLIRAKVPSGTFRSLPKRWTADDVTRAVELYMSGLSLEAVGK